MCECVFVYSPYYLNLSFLQLVVILTLQTPKNTSFDCAFYAELKYLPNFPTQKNPEIKNFKPKKILLSSPSLEIPPSTPLGVNVFHVNVFNQRMLIAA